MARGESTSNRVQCYNASPIVKYYQTVGASAHDSDRRVRHLAALELRKPCTRSKIELRTTSSVVAEVIGGAATSKPEQAGKGDDVLFIRAALHWRRLNGDPWLATAAP